MGAKDLFSNTDPMTPKILSPGPLHVKEKLVLSLTKVQQREIEMLCELNDNNLVQPTQNVHHSFMRN